MSAFIFLLSTQILSRAFFCQFCQSYIAVIAQLAESSYIGIILFYHDVGDINETLKNNVNYIGLINIHEV